MLSRPILIGSRAVLLGALAAGTCPIWAQAYLETDPFDASVMAIEKSLRTDRDGSNHTILLALRQLNDPAVRPIFQRLLTSEDPLLRIDGLLALAELSEESIDPFLLEQFKPRERIVALAGAIDLKLVDAELARKVLTFDTLDQVELAMISALQIDLGVEVDQQRLREMLGAKDPATGAIAAVLLADLGDPSHLDGVMKHYAESDRATRNIIGSAVVDIASWHASPGAISFLTLIAYDHELPRSIRLAAVDAALGCECEPGIELWHDASSLSSSSGDRTRLGVAALERGITTFDWSGIRDDRPLNQTLASAGEAYASGDGILENAKSLLAMHHPLMLQAAIALAEHASPAEADGIRVLIIEEAITDLRLYAVAGRTITDLADSQSEQLTPMLEIIAASDQPQLSQFAMIGLLNSRNPEVGVLAKTFRENDDRTVRSMALIVQARHGVELDDLELEELALIASGGGRVDPTARALAAWFWLGRTGAQQRAIARIVGEA
jgi:hypothetical protein